MPAYNVILSSQLTTAEPYGNLVRPINNSNLANTEWLVNWDGLFGNDALRYTKCILRYRLVSEPVAVGTLTPAANTGYIGLTGVATDKQAGNFPSTFIGLITPETSPSATASNRFNVSTLGDFHGMQVHVPQGVGSLGVRFYNDDAMSFQTGVPNYIMHLQFFLYNDEKE